MVAVTQECFAGTTGLVARIAVRTSVPADVVERILPGVLHALGEHLTCDQRQVVADELPPALGAVLLIEHMLLPRSCRMSDAQMRAFVAVTCSVLVDALSPRALRLLRTSAPTSMQPLLARAARGSSGG